MMSIKKLFAGALAVGGLLMTMGVAPVFAQESVPQTSEGVTAAADVLAVVTPAVEKSVAALSAGDTAWMLVSTMLVILMIIPGLALFYGGLARSKNTLSVLMQIFMIFSLIPILWVIYGYSAVFSGGGLFYDPAYGSSTGSSWRAWARRARQRWNPSSALEAMWRATPSWGPWLMKIVFHAARPVSRDEPLGLATIHLTHLFCRRLPASRYSGLGEP